MSDKIIFNFKGGMADEHALNFYEASRFQYGAARFIYTLEYFRQKGNVLQKISKKIDADIRVGTAKSGSWELEVALAFLPVFSECKIGIPLDVLFAYVVNLFKPKPKGPELVLALAKEHTKQSQEETKRLQLIKEYADGKEKTTQQALKAVQQTITILDKAGFQQVNQLTGKPTSKEEFRSIMRELKAERNYLTLIAPYSDDLDQISPDKEQQLSLAFRRVSKELAMPLRGSATSLHIGVSESANSIAVFDRETLEGLAKEIKDKVPTSLLGSIKAYDKETGWGKFRTAEFFKPLPFSVLGGVKNEFLAGILDAMAKEEVTMVFYIVRNANGTPTRLVFNKIIETEEE
jgi:hypothetical protein